ncbi:MAG: Mur ligase family protein, partial [Gemmatimonadales bacterium]
MSALALIAHRRGVPVTGCDTDPSGAADLSGEGVVVERGHDAGHAAGIRGMVVTAAVPAEHPEIRAARHAGIPVIPRKDALAALIGGRDTVALAGTHGKTSTTVMATLALEAAGCSPTGLAGGRVSAWGGNARPGGDELFVVEADEYDRALLALHPTVAVINNVEPDHLECYGTVAALEEAFAEFASRARHVFLGAEDPGARRVGSALPSPLYFGLRHADVRLEDVALSPDESLATVRFPGGREVALRLTVPGLHNLRNATGALCAVWALGADLDRATEALAGYSGLGRRFERLGEA